MDNAKSPASVNSSANSPVYSFVASSRSVKRPRPVKSCLECRKRKLRCDRASPCSQCHKTQRACRYAAEGDAASLSDGSDAETPERTTKRNRAGTSQESRQRNSDYAAVIEDHARRLERLEGHLLSRTLSTAGSSSTPTQRPAASSLTIRGLTVKGNSLRTRFFGQSSTRVLVNLFDEARDFMFSRNKTSDIRDLFLNLQKVYRALQDEHRKVTAPITVYVDSMTPIQKRMADVLPSRAVCDSLVSVYLSGSENIYRVLHSPSFMHQYNQYWEGITQCDAFLPQLLSILCVGYRYLKAGKGQFHDREGIHIPTASSLVRTWLDSLRGKQLVEFSTLQAEILQLMARRMISPQNQESWTHLGLIVRMAMTMGLHRDPSEFARKIPPFWAEQRRRLWYTILELDVHMSMQCNLPCCIRDGDFTCLPPRNLNDEDIHPNMEQLPPSKPIDQHTDSRVQVFAASTLSMRFRVVDLINRIESLQDYQPVLELGSELERVFEDVRYIVPLSHSMREDIEARRKWVIRVVLDMHCRRPLLALYRPFALSHSDVPQQIVTGYLRSSVILLSYLDELDPSLPDYSHVWHMHQVVLKREILQAAFSVCYYMKQAADGTDLLVSPNSDANIKSEPLLVGDSCIAASESSVLLSLPRLRSSVKKVLDTLLKRIWDIGTDLRDLVSLTVVFYTSQGGTPEQKRDAIKGGLQAILEASLQAIHVNQDNMTSIPVRGVLEYYACGAILIVLQTGYAVFSSNRFRVYEPYAAFYGAVGCP
ncbi:fungal-specific transcription factor domain-containing protein [Hypoxylon fragiforme]|uniref:fungal-specific transcription factor domain-containing protein n=1 Tax=Hypoxylon fragiforme TaxID=63214 RepID=UPI0020C6052B|nr:fungal-specific transcription factor domain-containing protein [Hypoxylon fragiforme]KAI2611261.1 fungal-specific transcription factor domain-containing protein [Hypoxylon fragiforme]